MQVGFGFIFGVVLLTSFDCGRSKVVSVRSAETYSTKYDNIDVKSIVSSARLMRNYANCLLDKGPCSPEGKELKTYLPEAMKTNCAKCSEKQKEISGIVLAHLVHSYNDLYNQLLDKYDEDGSFRKQLEGGDEEDDDAENNRK